MLDAERCKKPFIVTQTVCECCENHLKSNTWINKTKKTDLIDGRTNQYTSTYPLTDYNKDVQLVAICCEQSQKTAFKKLHFH